jgi:hypothetical protein
MDLVKNYNCRCFEGQTATADSFQVGVEVEVVAFLLFAAFAPGAPSRHCESLTQVESK